MSTENNKRKLVNIYMEANPNPNSLKFVTSEYLVEEGTSYDFPTATSAQDAPLAAGLFNLGYVTRVFYSNNFVTVTKAEDKEWAEIQNEVKGFIKAHLEEEKPVLNEEKTFEEVFDENDPEIVKEIKSILDTYIRPAVEMDGGAISFHSFNEGVVKVMLQGACSGCPSSTITLKAGIENLLKSKLPEVKAVEAEGV